MDDVYLDSDLTIDTMEWVTMVDTMMWMTMVDTMVWVKLTLDSDLAMGVYPGL